MSCARSRALQHAPLLGPPLSPLIFSSFCSLPGYGGQAPADDVRDYDKNETPKALASSAHPVHLRMHPPSARTHPAHALTLCARPLSAHPHSARTHSVHRPTLRTQLLCAHAHSARTPTQCTRTHPPTLGIWACTPAGVNRMRR